MSFTPWKTAIELLYPARCPVCDGVLPYGKKICDGCRKIPEPVGDIVCLKCGKPLEDPALALCSDCGRIRHYYDRGCSVYRYRSVSGSVFRMKYEGRAEYAAYFSEKMADRVRSELGCGFDCVVPVPSSPLRTAKRGYDQALLLARGLSRSLSIPLREDLLKRVRNTEVLRNLGLSERRKNLKKAFIVYGNDVEFRKIILVDDIYTTGSTIDACSLELKRKGAASVCFVTLAIGECYL